jgi:hypothetical protein
METPRASNSSALGELLPKLMGFVTVVRNLAQRFTGVARFLALSGLLAALWLAYVTVHSFGFQPAAAILAGIVMALPALVLGWVWFVLEQATELPERLADWMSRAHYQADATLQSLQQGSAATGGRRLGDLKPLAGLAYELRSMGGDARELMTTLGGAMSLSNPLFLLLVAASTIAIVFLDLASVVSGLISLAR